MAIWYDNYGNSVTITPQNQAQMTMYGFHPPAAPVAAPAPAAPVPDQYGNVNAPMSAATAAMLGVPLPTPAAPAATPSSDLLGSTLVGQKNSAVYKMPNGQYFVPKDWSAGGGGFASLTPEQAAAHGGTASGPMLGLGGPGENASGYVFTEDPSSWAVGGNDQTTYKPGLGGLASSAAIRDFISEAALPVMAATGAPGILAAAAGQTGSTLGAGVGGFNGSARGETLGGIIGGLAGAYAGGSGILGPATGTASSSGGLSALSSGNGLPSSLSLGEMGNAPGIGEGNLMNVSAQPSPDINSSLSQNMITNGPASNPTGNWYDGVGLPSGGPSNSSLSQNMITNYAGPDPVSTVWKPPSTFLGSLSSGDITGALGDAGNWALKNPGLVAGGIGALGSLAGAIGGSSSSGAGGAGAVVAGGPAGPGKPLPTVAPLNRTVTPYTGDPLKYAQAGQGGTHNFFGGAPNTIARAGGGTVSPLDMAAGKMPSRHANGPGGGRDDLIDAKVADGEFIFSSDVVSALGDGSNDEGAKRLQEAVRKIRARRNQGGTKLPPKAKSPLDYLRTN